MVARVITEENIKEEAKTKDLEDSKFKNQFAIATFGLLPGYVNPLKELELKSKYYNYNRLLACNK